MVSCYAVEPSAKLRKVLAVDVVQSAFATVTANSPPAISTVTPCASVINACTPFSFVLRTPRRARKQGLCMDRLGVVFQSRHAASGRDSGLANAI
jgi:hypothetical protein